MRNNRMVLRAAKWVVLFGTVLSLSLFVSSIILTHRLESAGIDSPIGSIKLQEWGVLINAYPHLDDDLRPIKTKWSVIEVTQYRPRAQWLPHHWSLPGKYPHKKWFHGWSLFAPLWIPFLLGVVLSIVLWVPQRRISGHLCSRCDYDLTGNMSGICPECGMIAATGTRKARLAIRWAVIARSLCVAMLMIAAAGAGALWIFSYANSTYSIRTRQFPATGWQLGSIVDYDQGKSRVYAKGLFGRFYVHARRTDGAASEELRTGLLQFQLIRTPSEWTFVIPLWFPMIILLAYPLWVMVGRPIRRQRLRESESARPAGDRETQHVGEKTHVTGNDNPRLSPTSPATSQQCLD